MFPGSNFHTLLILFEEYKKIHMYVFISYLDQLLFYRANQGMATYLSALLMIIISHNLI